MLIISEAYNYNFLILSSKRGDVIKENKKEIEDFIYENYLNMTSEEIAKVFNISSGYVRSIARELNIIKVKKPNSDNNKDFILNNYYDMSVSEISTTLGITETSVRRIASQLKLSKRNYLSKEDYIDSDFKSIKGFSNYEINSNGVVIRKNDLIIIKHTKDIFGYISVRLSDDNGNRKTQFVHRLLLSAFVGNSELQVNHIDGNTSNNCLSNLEYVTCSENLIHASENGLFADSHLDEEKVKNICELLEKGLTIVEIIDATNNEISPYIIRSIKRKTSWKDISKNYNL